MPPVKSVNSLASRLMTVKQVAFQEDQVSDPQIRSGSNPQGSLQLFGFRHPLRGLQPHTVDSYNAAEL